MPFHYLFFRCGVCGGQLAEDGETNEVFCSGCGLSYEDLADAKPMEISRKPFEDYAAYIREAKTRHKEAYRKKHAGGRPRTKPYMKLQDFVLASHGRYISPIKLKPTSPIGDLLWSMVALAIKKAVVEVYEMLESGKRWKGEVLRCSKCGTRDSGANAELTINLKHSDPRLRITLSCSHRLELRLKCVFCGQPVKTAKDGFFECNNSPKCFSFSIKEIEKAAKKEFGELLSSGETS